MTFADHGYEVIEGAIPIATCDAARAHLEQEIARASREAGPSAAFWPRFGASASRASVLWDDDGPPSPASAIRYGHALHRADPLFAVLCASDPIRAALERALGPGATILQAAVVRKPPDRPAAQFGWHQDAWYLPATPDAVALAFVPLDDTTLENGCLEVLPGSHRRGRTATLVLGEDGFAAGDGRAGAPIDARGAVALELPRGALALVHGLTFHASGPNRTNAPRSALIVHAIARGARLDPRAWIAGR